MREIQLTQGQVALIDEADYEFVSQYKWQARRRARRYGFSAVAFCKGKRVYLHRMLTNAPRNTPVDHVNGDTLDNTRANLRIYSLAQNQANRKLNSTSRSGFKGVHFRARNQKWCAQLQLNGKKHFLGYFDTPEEAARAYDKAALEHWGEFARLNLPLDTKPHFCFP